MTPETTIVIADDHPIFRKGLRQIIEGDPSMRIVAEAEEGEAALKQIRQHRPHVAVLDVDMPRLSGLDLAKALRDEESPTAIIFLTMYKEEDMFNSALDLGVMGYVLKENATGDIIQSIRSVRDGKHYISPTISGFLLDRSERNKAFARVHPSLGRLTPAERRILKLVSEKKTSSEIAQALHISEKTVENHRTNISEKLNLRGSHSLLKFALENRSYL